MIMKGDRSGNSVYHICEFAELLERGGGRCEKEPDISQDMAAWELGGRGYLLLEKTSGGYQYELLTKDYLSRTQGFLDRPSWTMNKAREHVLETAGLDRQRRMELPYDLIRQHMKEVLKACEVTQIEWIDSKYYPHMRTAEHTLECQLRGERLVLTYEVSGHDDGESFHIRSDGRDIWEEMPESELRNLEFILSRAVEFGHWKRDIDQAQTLPAIRDVRFSIGETENLNLSREQIGKLYEMIDQKEKALAGRSHESEELPVINAQETAGGCPSVETKPARCKQR